MKACFITDLLHPLLDFRARHRQPLPQVIKIEIQFSTVVVACSHIYLLCCLCGLSVPPSQSIQDRMSIVGSIGFCFH